MKDILVLVLNGMLVLWLAGAFGNVITDHLYLSIGILIFILVAIVGFLVLLYYFGPGEMFF
jgi:hypothetical protein